MFCLLATAHKHSQHRQPRTDRLLAVSNQGESLWRLTQLCWNQHIKAFFLFWWITSLLKDRPYLRTKGNTPLYPSRDASPLLNTVSSIKWTSLECPLWSWFWMCSVHLFRLQARRCPVRTWAPHPPSPPQVGQKKDVWVYRYGYILLQNYVIIVIFSFIQLLYSFFLFYVIRPFHYQSNDVELLTSFNVLLGYKLATIINQYL